jgi:predicted RNA polymerase sigma factor
LFAVLEAIYAAYAFGWDDVTGADSRGPADEALWLARTLVELMPDEPEALGLLALLCRRSERRAADGAYVPISEQDSQRWDSALLAEGDRWLSLAAVQSRM